MGNVIAPQKVSDTLGADILRLWVAATDYSGELSISDEILKRVTEAYRRIRNTLRFLLSNTADFNPAKDAVAIDELLEIDRYALASMKSLQDEVMAHYEKFEFHPIVAKLQTYCSEELGSLYLDILKDRLYTSGEVSKARRSAQTGSVAYHSCPVASDGSDPVFHEGRSLGCFRQPRKNLKRATKPFSPILRIHCLKSRTKKRFSTNMAN